MELERFDGGWLSRLADPPNRPAGLPSSFVDAIIGYDIVGRFWLRYGHKVLYFAPDNLSFEDHDLAVSHWLEWLNSAERIESFYEDFRWAGWREEVARIPADHVLSLYPPPWTAEGKDLSRVSRRPIPVSEAWEVALSTKVQLDGPEAVVALLANELLSRVKVGPVSEGDIPRLLRQGLDRLIVFELRNNCGWWPKELSTDGVAIARCTRIDDNTLQLVGANSLLAFDGTNPRRVPIRLTLHLDAVQPFFQHLTVEVGDVTSDNRLPHYPEDSIVFFTDIDNQIDLPVIANGTRIHIIRWTIASSR